MFLKPLSQLFSCHAPGREVEHEALLIVNGGDDFGAVQNQERLHRRVGDAFVAVKEWVVERQREAQRRRFGVERRVQVHAAETGSWLSES